jgi:hypothetical protein
MYYQQPLPKHGGRMKARLLILLLIILISLPIIYSDQDEIFEGIMVFGNATSGIISGAHTVDTNATTACGADEFLDGDGDCVGVSTIDSNLTLGGTVHGTLNITRNLTLGEGLGSQILAVDGSNFYPSYSFMKDPDTGFTLGAAKIFLVVDKSLPLIAQANGLLIGISGTKGITSFRRNLDDNTGIYFPISDDVLAFSSGGFAFLMMNESSTVPDELVINEESDVINTRIEGNNLEYLFFTNASTDTIGINESDPLQLLSIVGSTNISGDLFLDELVNCDTIDSDASGLLSCGSDAAGGDISNASIEDEYFKLDGSNNPITGNVSLLNNSRFYLTEYNDTYIVFNGTNNSLQFYVHGLLEAIMGQSVVFPRTTTFQENLVVVGNFTGTIGNISDGNLDVDQGNVTAIFIIGNGSLLTDVCLSNGTNCNVTTDDLAAVSDTNATTECGAGLYLDGSGSCIDINATIDDKISTIVTTVTPNWINVSTGTLDSGNISDVQVIDDSQTFNVSEVTGTPGFVIYANFTGVEDITDIIIHHIYTGSAGHTVDIELYDYNSGLYDDFGDLSEGSDFLLETFAVASDTDYISGTNSALRINHGSAGNVNHDQIIDYIALQNDPGGISITDHGQLGGLSDNDHSQYLLTSGGTMTGNLTVLIDYNVTIGTTTLSNNGTHFIIS